MSKVMHPIRGSVDVRCYLPYAPRRRRSATRQAAGAPGLTRDRRPGDSTDGLPGMPMADEAHITGPRPGAAMPLRPIGASRSAPTKPQRKLLAAIAEDRPVPMSVLRSLVGNTRIVLDHCVGRGWAVEGSQVSTHEPLVWRTPEGALVHTTYAERSGGDAEQDGASPSAEAL